MFDLQGKPWARQLSPQTFLSPLYVQLGMVCRETIKIWLIAQAPPDMISLQSGQFRRCWLVGRVSQLWRQKCSALCSCAFVVLVFCRGVHQDLSKFHYFMVRQFAINHPTIEKVILVEKAGRGHMFGSNWAHIGWKGHVILMLTQSLFL